MYDDETQLAKERIQGRAFVKKVMNVRVPQKAGISWQKGYNLLGFFNNA
jgi:hypothetical protein